MKTKIIAQEIDKIDFSALFTANNFAGKIAVVYKEGDNSVADIAVRAVEQSGNFVKRVAYPNDVLVNDEALGDLLELSDEIRFIIAIGGRSISELVSCAEREYMLILTELNTAEYLAPRVVLDGSLETLESKPPTVVCINKTSLSVNSQNLAKAYACIISHYSILPDMWFNNCFGCVDCKYLDNLEKVLQRISSKPVERNSSESIDRIIKANIELAELNFACSTERSVFLGARYAAMDITQELDGVELGALWSVYLYNFLAKLLPTYCENLCFPTDLAELTETMSSQSGIDSNEIIRRLSRVECCDVLTRDYVLIEYKDDIAAKISSKIEQLSTVLKQLKRLYDDAGQKLSSAIKIKEFKLVFIASSLVVPIYTLPKHLCLMGILS